MALTRAQARARLAATFAELLSEAGVVDADTDGGLKEPIDDALRDLGVAEDDLSSAIPNANVRGFLALAEYYVLRRVWRAVARFVDIRLDAPEVDKKRSQLAKAVKEQLDEAKAAAEGYGLGGGAAFSYGAITLDILEPEVAD